MQSPDAVSFPFLLPGQRYHANSFDLGFINVEPVDLFLEVVSVHAETNELLLALLPEKDEDVRGKMMGISRWFGEVYPTLQPDECFFRNLQAFGRLIELGVLVAEQDLAKPLPAGKATVQRSVERPSLLDMFRPGSIRPANI